MSLSNQNYINNYQDFNPICNYQTTEVVNLKLGNRFIQRPNRSSEIIPNHPAFIFGEEVFRPTIDTSITLGKYVWKTIHQSFSAADYFLTKAFTLFPVSEACSLHQERKVSHDVNGLEQEKLTVSELKKQPYGYMLQNECPIRENSLDLKGKNKKRKLTNTGSRNIPFNTSFLEESKAKPTFRSYKDNGATGKDGIFKNSTHYKEIQLISYDQFQTVLDEYFNVVEGRLSNFNDWVSNVIPKEMSEDGNLAKIFPFFPKISCSSKFTGYL